jgi:hypothetical protein
MMARIPMYRMRSPNPTQLPEVSDISPWLISVPSLKAPSTQTIAANILPTLDERGLTSIAPASIRKEEINTTTTAPRNMKSLRERE